MVMSQVDSHNEGIELCLADPESPEECEKKLILHWIITGELDEESVIVYSELSRIILEQVRFLHKDENEDFELSVDAIRRFATLDANSHSANTVRLLRERVAKVTTDTNITRVDFTAEELAATSILGAKIVEFVMSQVTFDEDDWAEIALGSPINTPTLLSALLKLIGTDPFAKTRLLMVAEHAKIKLTEPEKESPAFIKGGNTGRTSKGTRAVY